MDRLRKKAEEVKEICYAMSSPLIVHHYDADGISSASIVYGALKEKGKKPRLLCLNTLNEEALDVLEKDKEVIFVDLGSNNERVKEMGAVVIDHHGNEGGGEGILNPNAFGMDGGVYASSSSLAYFVFRHNRRAALIGAAGDMQMPFTGLNEELLKEGVVEEKVGLKLYGKESRSINNLLAFSIFNMDYRYTKKFLERVGVDGKKKFPELSEEERGRLLGGLIDEVVGSRDLSLLGEVFGKTYEFRDDFYGIRDLREVATMLNACGRYGRPWLGIRYCIEGKVVLNEVEKMLKKHKYEIKKAKKIAKEKAVVEEGLLILDGRGKIEPNIIGVVCSSIHREVERVVLGIAREGKKVKISLRCPEEVNATEVLNNIVEKVGGVAGGHKRAGGAEFDEDKLNIFIDEFRKRIKGLCISK